MGDFYLLSVSWYLCRIALTFQQIIANSSHMIVENASGALDSASASSKVIQKHAKFAIAAMRNRLGKTFLSWNMLRIVATQLTRARPIPHHRNSSEIRVLSVGGTQHRYTIDTVVNITAISGDHFHIFKLKSLLVNVQAADFRL